MTSSPSLLWWLAAAIGFAAVFLLGRASSSQGRLPALPDDWALMARPVLNSDERRVLRLLREALPQYTVLAKLPLVRLCQPRDPKQGRYWFELLGPVHVSFAICSANGRVMAVVDLQPERGMSRRARDIKQAVLQACRVRYLCCRAENLPSASELQLLMPHQGPVSRPAPLHAVQGFQQARSSLSDTVRTRRAERARWVDSGLPVDSFFAPDSRFDALAAEAAGPSSGFGDFQSSRNDGARAGSDR